jgi:hypothetical protein
VNKLIKILTSLRLTVICLCFGIALVFIGTIAQVDEGLYQAQNRYFRSLLVWWSPDSHIHIPIFPGGYLVGGLLLANLIAAHISRFKVTKHKIGILLTHFGLILLFVGQFATDLFSHESAMRLTEGESKNYSEAFRESELALIDTSDANSDRVTVISESLLTKKKPIQSDKLPVTVDVKNYWPNARLFRTPAIASNIPPGTVLPKDLGVTGGDPLLQELCVQPLPLVTDTEQRNVPAALVEFSAAGKSLGTYLVTASLDANQTLDVNGKSYDVALRFERVYYPFSLTLLKATHEQYKGTDIPKNFASRVRIENPEKHEARETDIYMNNPLRYAGLTFFQFQMEAAEMHQAGEATSTFQVVHNPSWITPYLACILVAAGLIIQFMTHLVKFAMKQRTPAGGNTKPPRGKDGRKENAKLSQEVSIS